MYRERAARSSLFSTVDSLKDLCRWRFRRGFPGKAQSRVHPLAKGAARSFPLLHYTVCLCRARRGRCSEACAARPTESAQDKNRCIDSAQRVTPDGAVSLPLPREILKGKGKAQPVVPSERAKLSPRAQSTLQSLILPSVRSPFLATDSMVSIFAEGFHLRSPSLSTITLLLICLSNG